MITYKIIETTLPYYLGIEIQLDFSTSKIGDTFNVLGLDMDIQQLGQVISLASKDNILVFQQTEG